MQHAVNSVLSDLELVVMAKARSVVGEDMFKYQPCHFLFVWPWVI